MPHQCTDCGRTFDDGSQEMLSGCPDCGGNKFQYKPAGSSVDEREAPAEEPPEPPEPPVDSSVARTVGNAATAVRDLVGSSPSPPEPADGADEPSPSEPTASTSVAVDASPTETTPEPTETAPDTAETVSTEDTAQASARSDIVSKDELPPAPDSPATNDRPTPVIDDDSDGTTAAESETDSDDTADRDRPGLSELRSELNDQFESIKVLDPGKYELNLMELYDREEYIIALQEDGKYTIQVPERWEDS
jgi:predicted  nucleic acid-binding Zn-ribbon protein